MLPVVMDETLPDWLAAHQWQIEHSVGSMEGTRDATALIMINLSIPAVLKCR